MLEVDQMYGTIILRIVLSVVLGGVVGLEREAKNSPAGFRTHTLVCLGSMTIMLLSELLFERYYAAYGITSDPARLAAQVVSGVGFLGAGTIIHYGSMVKGLTTAASIWVVAAIGLAIGSGFYFLAIAVFLAVSGILFVFNKLSHKLGETGQFFEMIVQVINKPKALGGVSLFLGRNQAEIVDMTFLDFAPNGSAGDKHNEIAKVRIVIKLTGGIQFFEILQGIQAINGVINVERI